MSIFLKFFFLLFHCQQIEIVNFSIPNVFISRRSPNYWQKKLFIIFPYLLFTFCKIYSDVFSFTADLGNLCSLFLFLISLDQLYKFHYFVKNYFFISLTFVLLLFSFLFACLLFVLLLYFVFWQIWHLVRDSFTVFSLLIVSSHGRRAQGTFQGLFYKGSNPIHVGSTTFMS